MRKPKSPRQFLHAAVEGTAYDSDRKVVASLVLTQIVKTHLPILESSSPQAMTYGEILDAQLLQAAQDGRIIQDVTFGFELEDWNDYADHLRSTNPHYIPAGSDDYA